MLTMKFLTQVEVYEVRGEGFHLKDNMEVAVGDLLFDSITCSWVTGFQKDGQMILEAAHNVAKELVKDLWKKKHFGISL